MRGCVCFLRNKLLTRLLCTPRQDSLHDVQNGVDKVLSSQQNTNDYLTGGRLAEELKASVAQSIEENITKVLAIYFTAGRSYLVTSHLV